jgi:hypothetical protein
LLCTRHAAVTRQGALSLRCEIVARHKTTQQTKGRLHPGDTGQHKGQAGRVTRETETIDKDTSGVWRDTRRHERHEATRASTRAWPERVNEVESRLYKVAYDSSLIMGTEVESRLVSTPQVPPRQPQVPPRRAPTPTSRSNHISRQSNGREAEASAARAGRGSLGSDARIGGQGEAPTKHTSHTGVWRRFPARVWLGITARQYCLAWL